MERVKCLIIGSGPAGFTAAIYASRANLNPVLYEGPQSGGQLITTTVVENFPGYPQGVSGYDMMEDMRTQAARFGATIRMGIVTAVDFGSAPYTVTIDDGSQLQADTVIISTGATAKYLGLEDEKKYAGRGVSACATCDGFFFRKKVVAVVGDGAKGDDQHRDNASVNQFSVLLEELVGLGNGLSHVLLTHFLFGLGNFCHICFVS